MKNFGISGFKSHPPSTIVGIIFVISGIVSVFLGKSDWPGAAVIIGVGLALWKGKSGSNMPPAAAIAAILLLFVASCSPARRLARLEKKHTELFTGATITGTAEIPTDTPAINSAIDSTVNAVIKDSPSPEVKTALIRQGNELKKVFANNPVPKLLKDTITADSAGVSVKIWQDGNKLTYKVIQKKTTPKPIPMAPKSISWKLIIVLVSILLILCFLYKLFAK